MIGPALAGTAYRHVRAIGAGSTADVFEVEHTSLGTRHALKVVAADHPALVARIRREARVQAAIAHPNVLPVLDVIDVDGLPGLVLPLINGSDLDALLATRALEPADALALFHGIAAGVAAIHAAGFVHRDLKPANILLACEGATVVPRVADLGLARAIDEVGWSRLTRAGAVVGTPAYAAPEQLDGRAVGPPADVWALGCVLRQMLTGARPGALAAPLPAGLSAAVIALIDDALAPDPAQRPPDGAAVVARLGPIAPLTIGRIGWRAPPTAAPGLPVDPEDLVGREEELRALADHLERPGLVSVVGPPGVGKTRVALRAAHRAHRFGRQRVWVPLAGVEHAADALARVAAAVELPESSAGVPLPVRIGRALAGRDAFLLVLDGGEAVLDLLAAHLSAWIGEAPALRLVVVGRRVFARARAVRVGPLPAADGARLLVDRARAARPGWQPSDADWRALPALVAELDGSPLALTLAARRIRLMSVAELVARLDQRFRLLNDGTGGLEAAIAASWDPLDAAERSVLTQLAVFAAPFTLDDAHAVVAAGEDTAAPVEVIARLVDASLVACAGERLSVSAAVRLFASARAGAEAGGAELRHGRWFGRLGDAEHIEALRGGYGPAVRADLGRAVPDLVAAHARAVARGDLDVERATALALHAAQPHGPTSRLEALLGRAGDRELELRDELSVSWLRSGRGDDAERVLREAPPATRPREALRWALGVTQILRETGRPAEALTRLERARAEADRADPADPWLDARAFGMLGLLRFDLGDARAGREGLERALAIARQHDFLVLEAKILGNLGALHQRRGDAEQASELYDRALRVSRACGQRLSEAIQLGNLGMIHRQLGRREQAVEALNQAAAIRRELGDLRGEAHLATSLALLMFAEGRQRATVDHYVRAQHLARTGGFAKEEAMAVANRGSAELGLGDLAAASEHLELGLAMLEAVGDPWHACHVVIDLGYLAFVRGESDAALAHVEQGRARAVALGFARAEGQAFEMLGRVHHHRGELADAVAAWQAGAAACARSGDVESGPLIAAHLARAAGAPDGVRTELERLPDGVIRASVAAILASAVLDRGDGGDSVHDAATELGRALRVLAERRLDTVVAYGLAARLDDARGRPDDARRWRDRARALADEVGLPARSPLRP